MPTIGVTGHRRLPHPHRIQAGVDEALDHVEAMFPEGPITVVSSLAEGADQLIVRRALRRPRIDRLIALVPRFRTKTYEDTFSSEAGLAGFRELRDRAADVLPVSASRETSESGVHAEVNEQMLARTDVLVAVWDGREAKGPGGTASVVEKARARGVPVAWVYAGHRGPPNDLRPDDAEREPGTVTLWRFS